MRVKKGGINRGSKKRSIMKPANWQRDAKPMTEAERMASKRRLWKMKGMHSKLRASSTKQQSTGINVAEARKYS